MGEVHGRESKEGAVKPGPTAPGGKSPPPRGKPFTKDDPRINRDAQWKPGESGNPSGMPKDRAAAAAHIERRLREEFIDQAIDALKYHTVKGSAAHMIEALNRMAGKVADKGDLKVEVGALESLTDEELAAKLTEALEGLTGAK